MTPRLPLRAPFFGLAALLAPLVFVNLAQSAPSCSPPGALVRVPSTQGAVDQQRSEADKERLRQEWEARQRNRAGAGQSKGNSAQQGTAGQPAARQAGAGRADAASGQGARGPGQRGAGSRNDAPAAKPGPAARTQKPPGGPSADRGAGAAKRAGGPQRRQGVQAQAATAPSGGSNPTDGSQQGGSHRAQSAQGSPKNAKGTPKSAPASPGKAKAKAAAARRDTRQGPAISPALGGLSTKLPEPVKVAPSPLLGRAGLGSSDLDRIRSGRASRGGGPKGPAARGSRASAGSPAEAPAGAQSSKSPRGKQPGARKPSRSGGPAGKRGAQPKAEKSDASVDSEPVSLRATSDPADPNGPNGSSQRTIREAQGAVSAMLQASGASPWQVAGQQAAVRARLEQGFDIKSESEAFARAGDTPPPRTIASPEDSSAPLTYHRLESTGVSDLDIDDLRRVLQVVSSRYGVTSSQLDSQLSPLAQLLKAGGSTGGKGKKGKGKKGKGKKSKKKR